jgi:hypothetical protein
MVILTERDFDHALAAGAEHFHYRVALGDGQSGKTCRGTRQITGFEPVAIQSRHAFPEFQRADVLSVARPACDSGSDVCLHHE